MRKNINSVTVTGRIFEHKLELKTVQNQKSANYGKEFIGGKLDLAIDDEGLNVIPVFYTYVTATTKAGKPNKTFEVLKKIIDKNQTWVDVGKENAMIVKVSSAINLLDFYNRDNELVTSQRVEGGFVEEVSVMPTEDSGKLHDFTADMVITKTVRVEIDPEKNINEEFMRIRGVVFDFRNAILPIELILRNPKGMDYLENANINSKNPMYTKVWGKIDCATVVKKIVEESAWDEPKVSYVEEKKKEWRLTGLKGVPYEFGEEGILTMDELIKAQQDREVYLADVKKKAEEYQMSLASKSTAPASFVMNSTAVRPGDFNF